MHHPQNTMGDCWESSQHRYKEDDSSFCTWACILQSLNCSCKTGCNTSRCGCQKSQMQCTDVCQCNDCLKRSAILGKKKLMRPTTVTMMARILFHNKALFLDICYIFGCKQFDFDHLSCFYFCKKYYRILLIFANVKRLYWQTIVNDSLGLCSKDFNIYSLQHLFCAIIL